MDPAAPHQDPHMEVAVAEETQVPEMEHVEPRLPHYAQAHREHQLRNLDVVAAALFDQLWNARVDPHVVRVRLVMKGPNSANGKRRARGCARDEVCACVPNNRDIPAMIRQIVGRYCSFLS